MLGATQPMPKLHRKDKVVPTYDDEEDKANDEKGWAADRHSIGEVDEGREQKSGPEQEIEQRPGPTRGFEWGAGKKAFFYILLL